MRELNLAVHFTADGDLLQRVDLALARKFSYDFVGASFALQKKLTAWIESYLKGKPMVIELPLSEASFQQQVIDGLLTIPFGTTQSYSDLAKTIGNPKGARAVGNACGKNQFPLIIPCHRIIQKNGHLGGFALNPEIKRRLLSFECNHNRIF